MNKKKNTQKKASPKSAKIDKAKTQQSNVEVGDNPTSTSDLETSSTEASLNEQSSNVVSEVDEIKQLAQRIQADFENYKKRVAKERLEVQQRSTESLLSDLLPVIDSMEQALSASNELDHPIVEGLSKVQTQLMGTLSKHGLEELIVEEGFEPDKHEAVLTEGDGSLETPVVTEVLRKGYTIHGRVLRPAMVKVKN